MSEREMKEREMKERERCKREREMREMREMRERKRETFFDVEFFWFGPCSSVERHK